MGMKFCTRCGTKMNDDMRFCPVCGCNNEEKTENSGQPFNNNQTLFHAAVTPVEAAAGHTAERKNPKRKKTILIAAAVLVVVFAVVLLFGSGRSKGGTSPSPHPYTKSNYSPDEHEDEREEGNADADADYKTAYVNELSSILRQYGAYLDDEDYRLFLLVHLDNDNIPELLVNYSDANAYFSEIYCYKGGKAVKVGRFGRNNKPYQSNSDYSYIVAVPNAGILDEITEAADGSVSETIYKYKKGKAEMAVHFTIADPDGAAPLYYIDGKIVSREELRAERSKYIPEGFDAEDFYDEDNMYELNNAEISRFYYGETEQATTAVDQTAAPQTEAKTEYTTAQSKTGHPLISFIGGRTRDAIAYFGPDYELDGIITLDSPRLLYSYVDVGFFWENEWDGVSVPAVTGNELVTDIVLKGGRSDVILDNITGKTTYGELKRRFKLTEQGRTPDDEPILMDGSYWVSFTHQGYDLTFSYSSRPSDTDQALSIYICYEKGPHPYG